VPEGFQECDLSLRCVARPTSPVFSNSSVGGSGCSRDLSLCQEHGLNAGALVYLPAVPERLISMTVTTTNAFASSTRCA
jgi:hypothetical protein